MVELVEEYPNSIYLLVCVAAYFITGPGGVGGMVLYFMLTAWLVMPITIWVTDVVRGLTAQAIPYSSFVRRSVGRGGSQ